MMGFFQALHFFSPEVRMTENGEMWIINTRWTLYFSRPHHRKKAFSFFAYLNEFIVPLISIFFFKIIPTVTQKYNLIKKIERLSLFFTRVIVSAILRKNNQQYCWKNCDNVVSYLRKKKKNVWSVFFLTICT